MKNSSGRRKNVDIAYDLETGIADTNRDGRAKKLSISIADADRAENLGKDIADADQA